MSADSDLVISTLHKYLSRVKLTILDEEALQAQVEKALKSANIPYQREFSLSPKDRPDFMVRSTVIEIKIAHSAAAIHRQLIRYAEHGAVAGLVLMSLRPVTGLPPLIYGKPIRQFSVWSYCI